MQITCSNKPNNMGDNEKWISSYEETYSVDTLGSVYSYKFNKKKKIKSRPDAKGYLLVGLHHNGITKTHKVHRIVAMAFIPNPENKPQVNHKDGNKQNNYYCNLEWATSEENLLHAYRTGLKNSDHSGKPVISINLNTSISTRFNSMHEAERLTGISYKGICACCKGQIKTSGGLRWIYAK